MAGIFASMRENRPYPYLNNIFHHKGKIFDECPGFLSKHFDRIGKHGMQVNLEKSELMAETLTLLGFQLTRTGSRPTAKRIKAILKLGKPKDKRGVRRINGIVNFIKYYRSPSATPVSGPIWMFFTLEACSAQNIANGPLAMPFLESQRKNKLKTKLVPHLNVHNCAISITS